MAGKLLETIKYI